MNRPSTRRLTPSSVHRIDRICTRCIPISGATMGKHRNSQVHPSLYHDSKPHRSNLQLAGIRGNQKRRVSVSARPFAFLVFVLKLCSYSMQYSGQSALQIAVLVAFTQLIPEHQVQVLGVLRARVKVGPLPACSNQ